MHYDSEVVMQDINIRLHQELDELKRTSAIESERAEQTIRELKSSLEREKRHRGKAEAELERRKQLNDEHMSGFSVLPQDSLRDIQARMRESDLIISELRAEISKKNVLLGEFRAANKVMKADFNGNDHLLITRESFAEKNHSIRELEAELQRKSNLIDSLTGNLVQVSDQRTALMMENIKLKETLSSAQVAIEYSIPVTSQAIAEPFKREMHKSNQQNNDLLSVLRGVEEKLSDTEQKLRETQFEFVEAQRRNDTLHSEIVLLRDLAEEKSLVTRQLKDECSRKEDSLRLLREELNRANDKLDYNEVSIWERKYIESESTCSRLRAKLQQYEVQEREAEGERDRVLLLLEEQNEAQRKLHRLETEIVRKDKEVEHAHIRLQGIEELKQIDSTVAQKLKSDNVKMKEENLQLQYTIDRLQALCKSKDLIEDAGSERADNLKSMLDMAQKKTRRLTSELQDLQLQLLKRDDTIQSIVRSIDDATFSTLREGTPKSDTYTRSGSDYDRRSKSGRHQPHVGMSVVVSALIEERESALKYGTLTEERMEERESKILSMEGVIERLESELQHTKNKLAEMENAISDPKSTLHFQVKNSYVDGLSNMCDLLAAAVRRQTREIEHKNLVIGQLVEKVKGEHNSSEDREEVHDLIQDRKMLQSRLDSAHSVMGRVQSALSAAWESDAAVIRHLVDVDREWPIAEEQPLQRTIDYLDQQLTLCRTKLMDRDAIIFGFMTQGLMNGDGHDLAKGNHFSWVEETEEIARILASDDKRRDQAIAKLQIEECISCLLSSLDEIKLEKGFEPFQHSNQMKQGEDLLSLIQAMCDERAELSSILMSLLSMYTTQTDRRASLLSKAELLMSCVRGARHGPASVDKSVPHVIGTCLQYTSMMIQATEGLIKKCSLSKSAMRPRSYRLLIDSVLCLLQGCIEAESCFRWLKDSPILKIRQSQEEFKQSTLRRENAEKIRRIGYKEEIQSESSISTRSNTNTVSDHSSHVREPRTENKYRRESSSVTGLSSHRRSHDTYSSSTMKPSGSVASSASASVSSRSTMSTRSEVQVARARMVERASGKLR